MADINTLLAKKYDTLGQQGLAPKPAAPVSVGAGLPATAGTPIPTFGKNGQFGDVGLGKTGTAGGFSATNFGPGLPAVISATHSNPIGDMQSMVASGYTPEEASRAVQAAAASTLGVAQADAVPTDTASMAALRLKQGMLAGAEANEAGVRASVLPGRSAAQNTLDASSANVNNTAASINRNQNRNLNYADPAETDPRGIINRLLGGGLPGGGLGWLRTGGGLP